MDYSHQCIEHRRGCADRQMCRTVGGAALKALLQRRSNNMLLHPSGPHPSSLCCRYVIAPSLHPGPPGSNMATTVPVTSVCDQWSFCSEQNSCKFPPLCWSSCILHCLDAVKRFMLITVEILICISCVCEDITTAKSFKMLK